MPSAAFDADFADAPDRAEAVPGDDLPASFAVLAGDAEAAAALAAWHEALRDAGAAGATFEGHAVLDAEGWGPGRLPADVCRAAYDAAEAAHAKEGRGWLAAQAAVAARWHAPLRFADHADLVAFARAWAGSHARLVAGLGGYATRWHVGAVDELATGFFLADRLLRLPDDLAAGRCFVPDADLAAAGVSREALRAGDLDEALRKVLWKQTVRVRDALAQGRGFLRDLPRLKRLRLARDWHATLRRLDLLEERDYDLWRGGPVTLSPLQRAFALAQAALGRSVTA
jgi:phytoene synthase